MDVEELCSNKKEKLSRGAAKRQQIKYKKHLRQPEGEDSSWSVEGTSQANGHVNSKDRANRPKQERAQNHWHWRPSNKPTELTKEEGSPPAKTLRPMANGFLSAPYVSADVSLLQPAGQVTTRDSMPALVMSPRSQSSHSRSSRSQTGSSTSSTASSSTVSEAIYDQVDPMNEDCPSEDSHSSDDRSEPMPIAPRGQGKRTVTRILESVQVLYAAGRQEVLPPETVIVNGSE